MDQFNQSNSFVGSNGFTWWVGVVENREDPLNLCRCQIRIFGWHTDNKQQVPTDDLPWAQPAFAVNAAHTNKTPYEGDWVVGFFFDGASGQFPVYFGVLPGIPAAAGNSQKGFNDPRPTGEVTFLENGPGNYPGTYPRATGEPSTSRLYRNEKSDTTVVGKIKKNKKTGVAISSGGSWDQPDPSYAAKAPYNNVTESESGHTLELDDTPGAERVHLSHRSGTHTEMRPDGKMVTKVVNNNYELVIGDDFIYVSGTCNITVDGNVNLKVGGNVDADVGGNVDARIAGNVTAKIGGNVTETIDGSRTCKVGGSYTITAGGPFTVKAPSINLN